MDEKYRDSKEKGIAEWSKLYGRQISETDHDEICQNVSGFFGMLYEWDKEDKKSGSVDKIA